MQIIKIFTSFRSSPFPPFPRGNAVRLGHSLRICWAIQTRAQALKHYETKVEFIRTNLEALQETITKKQENMNYLINVLQMKLQQQASAKDAKAG